MEPRAKDHQQEVNKGRDKDIDDNERRGFPDTGGGRQERRQDRDKEQPRFRIQQINDQAVPEIARQMINLLMPRR